MTWQTCQSWYFCVCKCRPPTPPPPPPTHLVLFTWLHYIPSHLTTRETIRTIRDGGPRTATSSFTQLLNTVLQCFLMSRETIRNIRDGEPRTATSTFTQLLYNAALRPQRLSGTGSPGRPPRLTQPYNSSWALTFSSIKATPERLRRAKGAAAEERHWRMAIDELGTLQFHWASKGFDVFFFWPNQQPYPFRPWLLLFVCQGVLIERV